MKILGISGSPRKGNTEWMVQKLLELAAIEGADTELLLLRKADIQLCRGCLACEAGGTDRKGTCVIKDDMTEILPKLMEADGIVMGSPVYFEMISGLLKNFIDRTCPVWPKLTGKKMAGLAVAEEGIGKTVDNLKTYASVCSLQWIGSVTILAKKPGDAAKTRGLEARLKRLAKKLVLE